MGENPLKRYQIHNGLVVGSHTVDFEDCATTPQYK